FFFQAEDGIRDDLVTGVQTCALPISRTSFEAVFELGPSAALTGPASRGDVGTVTRTLNALAYRAPDAARAYAVLAREAARLAAEIGRASCRERVENRAGAAAAERNRS